MSAFKSAKALVPVPPPDRVLSEDEFGRARCRDTCDFDARTTWHDRLTRVESDPDALLDLIELALTWHELEYSKTPIVAPEQWPAFMASHHWDDPDRVDRVFSIATDVVRAVGRATPHHAGALLRPEGWRGCLDPERSARSSAESRSGPRDHFGAAPTQVRRHGDGCQ